MYTLFKKQTNRLIFADKYNCSGSNFIRRYQDQLLQNINATASKMSKGYMVLSLTLFVIIAGSIYVCIVSKSFSKTASKTIPMNFISRPLNVVEKSSDTLSCKHSSRITGQSQ